METAKSNYSKLMVDQQTDSKTTGRLPDTARFVVVCMVLITIVSIFHVWSRFRLVELNLQVSEASRKLKNIEQEQRQLQLEVALLKTPARIEAIAKHKFGMVVPGKEQIILVKE